MTKPVVDQLIAAWGVPCIQKHVDAAGIILSALDVEGNITYVNRKGQEVLECSEEELLGKNWFDTCLPADERQRLLPMFRRLLVSDTEPMDHLECRMLTRSGKERTVLWHNRVLRDENGNRLGLFGSGADITDRKQTEVALRKSESRFRALTENATDLIVIVNEEGMCSYVSPSIQKFKGYSREEVLGKPITDGDLFSMHPDDAAMVLECVMRARQNAGDTIRIPDFRVRHPDGDWHYLEGLLTYLPDVPGIQGLVFNGRDVTERNCIEESLRESEERFRAIIETSPDAIALLDLNGQFLMANQRMAELAGVGTAEKLLALKNNCLDYLAAEDHERVRSDIRKVIELGVVPAVEYCACLPDGTRYPVEISSSLLKGPHGNPQGLISVVRDITKRKRAEEALRKSEEKFSLLFHASPAPISVSRLSDGCVIDCNESILRLFGFRRDEFLGSSTLDRWVDPSQRQHLLARLATEGAVREWECRFHHKDGHLILARLSAEIVEIEGEKYGLALFTDVTERHRAEEEIEKLALVVRHSSELVSLTDLNGRMMFLNEAGSRLLGIPPERVTQYTIRDIIPNEWLPTVRNEILPELKRSGAWEGDLQCLRVGSDERIDVRAMSFTVYDPHSGNPLCLAYILRDITDCKQAQAALQESEAKFRTIFESARDTIMLLSEEGFLDCNPRTLQMFGYANKADFVGLHPSQLSPPLQPDGRDSGLASREHIRRALQHGSERFEWVHRRGDGSDFPAEVVLCAFEYGGRRLLHATVRDVAERMKSQEAMQQAKDAAEAASRTKSEFLANMSHEIRTPLTAILGYADLLVDRSSAVDVRDAADTIRRNGEHLLQIISDILDISRIEAARLEPEYSRCSPRQLVEEVVSLMRVRAEGKGLRLAVEYEGAIPETIQTDPVRLRQILLNLVGNAIKFTEAGGVRVVASLVHEESQEPKMRFDVIDTGIGLAKAQLGMLFQPFSQIDGSLQRRFGGSGLGLAISKRLAEMLGGSISVASTPGKGSTFTVTVAAGPIEGARSIEHREPAASAPARPAADQVHLDCRLLLAEDGPDNQRLLSFVLRKAGAKVTVADNGQTAVEYALAAQGEGNPFDVVLMDMQMPVMDGYEATSRLRQAGCPVPIVALTAHAMTEDRQKCLSAGCNDYMSKPIVPGELVRLVASQLRKSPTRAADAP